MSTEPDNYYSAQTVQKLEAATEAVSRFFAGAELNNKEVTYVCVRVLAGICQTSDTPLENMKSSVDNLLTVFHEGLIAKNVEAKRKN